MKQHFFILSQTFSKIQDKKFQEGFRYCQMAANAFIIIRQHCYRRVLLVVPIIIIGLLWQKKKVSSSTTCPATRLPKMDNNHRSNNYFFNDLWCQRKKDKEVKKSFVLACIALFQYVQSGTSILKGARPDRSLQRHPLGS